MNQEINTQILSHFLFSVGVFKITDLVLLVGSGIAASVSAYWKRSLHLTEEGKVLNFYMYKYT